MLQLHRADDVVGEELQHRQRDDAEQQPAPDQHQDQPHQRADLVAAGDLPPREQRLDPRRRTDAQRKEDRQRHRDRLRQHAQHGGIGQLTGRAAQS